MDDPLGVFGQNLRRARRRLGMTQEELADAAELHRTHISKIERALCEPGVRTVARLLAALALSGGPLFEGVERRRASGAR
jgi:transcriptional regulator with XRE-family HTH domain